MMKFAGDSGVGGIFDSLLNSLGLRDPISHYEPGLSIPEVWAKYSAQVTRYQQELPLIRHGAARAELQRLLTPLIGLRDVISIAFQPGAVMGERDRERLAELVQGVRDYRKAKNDIENAYGLYAPLPPAGTEPVVAAMDPTTTSTFVPKGGSMVPLLIAGAVAFIIFGRKRR